MIFQALICYAAAAVIPVAALILLLKLLKRRGTRVSALHTVIGALSFIAVLVGMLVLMMFAFSETTTVYMTAFMSEAVYKITVSVLFFLAVGLVRYFLLNAAYFNRYKEDNGVSFLLGYGVCGGIAISVYCVFMFFLVLFTSLSSPFVSLSDQSVMMFESGSSISVFTPFSSHILFSVIFVLYSALMLVISMFMDCHSAHPYKWHSTLRMYLVTHVCELLAVLVVLFASTSVSPAAIAVILVCLTALSLLSVKLLYKYKDESPYEKQFE